MSETGSIAGSQSSMKSSNLKGWTSTSSAMRVSGRGDDIDITRSSTRSHDSYNSTNALRPAMSFRNPGASSGDFAGGRRDAPASSPTLGSFSDAKIRQERVERRSDMSAASSEARPLAEGSAGMEDQLKKERIWWSEQTMFEAHKMELTVKQELQKTSTALRDQFWRKLEIERNDSQLRASQLERSITRLREDLDSLRERQDRVQVSSSGAGDQAAAAAAVAAQADGVRRVEGRIGQVEESLRLEMEALRAGMEDHHRQQAEELSVALAAQGAFETERQRVRAEANQLREEFRMLAERVGGAQAQRSAETQRTTAELEARLERRLSTVMEEERGARVRDLEDVKGEARRLGQELLEVTVRAHTAQTSAAASSTASTGADTEAASVAVAMATAQVEELRRLLDEERASRKAEVEILRTDFSKEQGIRTSELSESTKAWREEAKRLAEEFSASHQNLSLEVTQAQALASRSSLPTGGVSMEAEVRFQELETALEKAREMSKADLELIRSTTSSATQKAISEAVAELEKRTATAAAAGGGGGEQFRDLPQCYKEVFEFCNLLQTEAKTRKSDVENLREQLGMVEALVMERAGAEGGREGLVSEITEMEVRVQNIVSALDTERESRRADADRFQANLQDINESIKAEKKLRTMEVEKLYGVLEELARNMDSAIHDKASQEQSRGLTSALATLRSALDEEVMASKGNKEGVDDTWRSNASSVSEKMYLELAAKGNSDRLQAEAGARRSDLSAALGREATELLARIRNLGAELRSELNGRVDVVTSTIRAEMASTADALKSDIVASCHDLHTELTREIDVVAAEARALGAAAGLGGAEGRPLGIERKAEAVGQLSEVLSLVQTVTVHSETLAERILNEASQRREADRKLEVRVFSVERRLTSLGVGEDSLSVSEAEEIKRIQMQLQDGGYTPDGQQQQQHQQYLQTQLQQQAGISEDLKDSLEKLVGRVNRMLKPEDGGAGSGSATPASVRGGSHAGIRTPMSIENSLRQAGPNRASASLGPRPTAGSRSPERQRNPMPAAQQAYPAAAAEVDESDTSSVATIPASLGGAAPGAAASAPPAQGLLGPQQGADLAGPPPPAAAAAAAAAAGGGQQLPPGAAAKQGWAADSAARLHKKVQDLRHENSALTRDINAHSTSGSPQAQTRAVPSRTSSGSAPGLGRPNLNLGGGPAAPAGRGGGAAPAGGAGAAGNPRASPRMDQPGAGPPGAGVMAGHGRGQSSVSLAGGAPGYGPGAASAAGAAAAGRGGVRVGGPPGQVGMYPQAAHGRGAPQTLRPGMLQALPRGPMFSSPGR